MVFQIQEYILPLVGILKLSDVYQAIETISSTDKKKSSTFPIKEIIVILLVYIATVIPLLFCIASS